MRNETEAEIQIDTSLIPTHTQEYLAAATLDFMKNLLSQPNGRELIDKKKVALGLL